jgi:hypothetical protein
MRRLLAVIPVDDTGQVLLEEYSRLLNDKTKIVTVTQASNALGTIVPLNADFFVFSGHKLFGRPLDARADNFVPSGCPYIEESNPIAGLPFPMLPDRNIAPLRDRLLTRNARPICKLGVRRLIRPKLSRCS